MLRQERRTIKRASSDYSREITLFSNDESERLCVVLDAEFYLERMDGVATIEKLSAHGAIPPTAFVFVPFVTHEDRQRDYTCNEEHADFITQEVYLWAKGQFPKLSERGHAICGLSLSALQAAFIQFRHGTLFSRVVCQSGSFWWNDEWLLSEVPERSEARCYLSVGNQETDTDVEHPPTPLRQLVSQVESNKNLADALRKAGAEVRFEIFDGNHEIEHWNAELSDALKWVLSAD